MVPLNTQITERRLPKRRAPVQLSVWGVFIHDYTVYFLITPLSKYLIELNNILDVSFINREGIINEKKLQ